MTKDINKKTNAVPKRSLLEEIGNAITHGIGSILGVIAFVLMLKKASNTVEVLSAIIYFLGIFILFTMSCLYHAFPQNSRVKRLFRRFDYSSIYLLIGATYTPLLLCYIKGVFGLVFFIIQWTIIITGITFIAVFGPGRLKWLHFPLYILLGWCGIIFMPQLFTKDLAFFLFILGGGLVYSLGIIPFVMKKKAAHFIWHFFVLFGAIIQWFGIYLYIYI